MKIKRRSIVAGIGAALAAPAINVHAQTPQRLNVYAHRVHRIVATGTQGGDITEAWARRTGIGVEWATFETGPLQERLFREASLSETTVDVGFIVNTQAVPRITTLFEPLDEFMRADPIEDVPDVFPGLLQGMTIEGKLYGLPFRHASSGMHYNEEMFAERGISGAPRTIEEFEDYCKRCTYTRGSTPVAGMVMDGANYPNVVDIARAWDGDFMTADMRVVASEPPMVKAITLLRDLFQTGGLPRNFAAILSEDVNIWMQTGRAAMCVTSLGRNQIYNDPQRSQFPGKIKATTIPIARELLGRYEVAPAKVEFWGMVIPKTSRNKQQAWSFMKEMLTKQNTLKAALNGNGPVRNSTYDDPQIKERLSYAEAERRVLRVARTPLPAFDQAQRAADIFKEEAQAAILGMKPPQRAMDDVTQRVRRLLGQ